MPTAGEPTEAHDSQAVPCAWGVHVSWSPARGPRRGGTGRAGTWYSRALTFIPIRGVSIIVIALNKNPLEGYRRLTFMTLDADVVPASPSSVYRVLSVSVRDNQYCGAW
jgi:hypothetical protein